MDALHTIFWGGIGVLFFAMIPFAIFEALLYLRRFFNFLTGLIK